MYIHNVRTEGGGGWLAKIGQQYGRLRGFSTMEQSEIRSSGG